MPAVGLEPESVNLVKGVLGVVYLQCDAIRWEQFESDTFQDAVTSEVIN